MSALAEAMKKAGLNKDKAKQVLEDKYRKERKKEKQQNSKYVPKTLDDWEDVFSAKYPDY